MNDLADPEASAPIMPAAHLVYLNFEGGTMKPGLEDVTKDTTKLLIPVGTKTFAAYQPDAFTSTIREEFLAKIVEHFRTISAPYDVDVVTERPAPSRKYTMIMIVEGNATQIHSSLGGTYALSGEIDWGNATETNFGIVFPDRFAGTNLETGALMIASTAAHELGHLLGLMDTQNEQDIMWPHGGKALAFGGEADIRNPRTGETVEHKCGGGTKQDSAKLVLAALGARKAR